MVLRPASAGQESFSTEKLRPSYLLSVNSSNELMFTLLCIRRKRYLIVLYRIVSYCIVLHCIVLYCIVLYCNVSHRIASHRIAPHRIVSYRIVLYSIEPPGSVATRHGIGQPLLLRDTSGEQVTRRLGRTLTDNE